MSNQSCKFKKAPKRKRPSTGAGKRGRPIVAPRGGRGRAASKPARNKRRGKQSDSEDEDVSDTLVDSEEMSDLGSEKIEVFLYENL